MSESNKIILVVTLSVLVFAVSLGLIGVLLEKLGRTIKSLNPATTSEQVDHTASLNIDYSKGQKIYVPAYSYLPGEGAKKFSLNILLSVRNTDPLNSISINNVDYYNTEGRLERQFLSDAILLAPLETKEFFVEQSDLTGGSGANFFITWDADSVAYEPVVEALMYNVSGDNSMEFKSQGLIIEQD